MTIRDDLTRAGASFTRARKQAATKKEEARVLAVKAAAEGVPDAEIARLLQVNRMTVLNWLGKRPTNPKREAK